MPFKSDVMWGIKWEHGKGAQERLIPDVNKDDVLIAHHSTKYGRKWAITTPESLEKLIKDDHGIYEIIMDRIHKVYFDIDFYGDENPLEQCKNNILQVLPDADLQISGNITPNVTKTDDSTITTKYSYHIVVDNYHFDGQLQHSGIRGFCRANEHLGFDWKVYTRNRQMKCIYQSKPKKPVQDFIEGQASVQYHLITAFFDLNSTNAEPMFEEFDDFTGPLHVNKIPQKHEILSPAVNLAGAAPIDIVNLLPTNLDHRITASVALYYIKLGRSFDDFWQWAKLKDSSESRLQKWQQYHWPWCLKIDEDGNNNTTQDTIIRILERFYPNIRKEYYTRVYLDSAHVPLDVDTKQLYVKPEDLTDSKVDYLTFPMGANKTGAIAKYLEINKDSCIFLNVRKTLAVNLMTRLPDHFIHYLDDLAKIRELCQKNGQQFKAAQTTDIKITGTPLCDHLVTTPYSLHYIGERNYDIVIIDEMEMFLTAWNDDKCHTHVVKKKAYHFYQQNWDTCKRLLLNAKKIIIMDALPSLNSIFYLQRVGITKKQISIIGTTKQAEPLNVEFVKDIEGPDASVKKIIKLMIAKLRDNKSIYIFWPYKKPEYGTLDGDQFQLTNDKIKLNRLTGFELSRLLENHVKRKLKGFIYNADTLKDKELKATITNVNETWKNCDYIIVNQSITVGVNFDLKEQFDSIFIANTAFTTCREFIQSSRRIRWPTSKTIYYVNLGGLPPRDKDITHLPTDHDIRDTIRDSLNENKAVSETCIRHMFGAAGMQVVSHPERYKIILPQLYKKYLHNDPSYLWDNIPDLDDPEVYERLCLNGAESVQDVLMLSKYQFRRLFKDDTPQCMLRRLWGKRDLAIRINKFLDTQTLPESTWINGLRTELKLENNSFMLPPKFTVSREVWELMLKNLCVDLTTKFQKTTPMQFISRGLKAFFDYDVYLYDKNTREYQTNPLFEEIWASVVKYKENFQAAEPKQGKWLLELLHQENLTIHHDDQNDPHL